MSLHYVYSLNGRISYEGDTLLAVFASVADLQAYVLAHQGPADSWQPATLGYDDLLYYASPLGQQINWMQALSVSDIV